MSSDKRDLIVVDTETTGLDVDKHWVLEVAAVNVRTGEELYFVPALPVGALDEAEGKALKLNGYFSRDVYAHRLSIETAWPYWLKLWDWLDGNTLGGSNPSFDAAMLNRSMQWCHNGIPTGYNKPEVPPFRPSPWHHRLADLSAYAAGGLGIEPTALPGLNVVCRSLQVENEAEHSALADARATAQCFAKLIARAQDRDAKAVTS